MGQSPKNCCAIWQSNALAITINNRCDLWRFGEVVTQIEIFGEGGDYLVYSVNVGNVMWHVGEYKGHRATSWLCVIIYSMIANINY